MAAAPAGCAGGRRGSRSPTSRARSAGEASAGSGAATLEAEEPDPAGLRVQPAERAFLGEHRAVLTLLAALVGTPGAATQAFGALLAEPPEVPWSEFLSRLQAAPVRSETRQLAAALRAVTDRTGLSGELATLQSWTPRDARYSFETARLVPEPMPRTG
ncbi:MAG: hypothetical protein ABI611_19190 [Solirubrobacteraceae bacterium]